VMGVVLADGVVRPDDAIRVELPGESHQPLDYIVDSHNPLRTPGWPQ
jgi:hypothetical protein